MKTVTVEEKIINGNVFFYPSAECDAACIFFELLNNKAFSRNDLDLITGLGYKLIIK